MQDAIRQVRLELDEAARRTVALLRWRISDDGPHQPLHVEREQWSLDREMWHETPVGVSGRSWSSVAPLICDEIRDDVQMYLDQGVEAPLALALWREAWELRGANDRSALLIGMAALEVGVKHYIAAVAPDTAWLLEELPAPPVHRLLDEYIPRLPTPKGEPVQPLGDAVRERIRKAQDLRNKVAHAGRERVDQGTVFETLRTIRAVLVTLDVNRGFAWAVNPNDE
jgi:hypothetical protein